MLRGNRRRQPQQLKAPGFAIEVRARLLHIHYSYDVIVKDSSRTTLTCAAAAARDGLLPVCQVPVVWWPQLRSHNTQQHMDRAWTRIMASFSRTQECNPQESIDVTRLSVTRVQVHSHYSLCNPRRFDMHIHNASGAHHPSRFVVIAHHEPHAQTEETGCSCPFRVVVLRRLSATPAAREGERRFQRTLRLRSAVAIFIRYPHPLGLCLIASFRQRLLRLRLCY